jgi:hypothetical protein
MKSLLVVRQLVLPQFDKFTKVEGHYIAVRILQIYSLPMGLYLTSKVILLW